MYAHHQQSGQESSYNIQQRHLRHQWFCKCELLFNIQRQKLLWHNRWCVKGNCGGGTPQSFCTQILGDDFDGNPKNKDNGNYKAKPVHLKSRTKQQWWRGGEEWWTPLPIWSAFSPVVHKLATVLSPNMDAKTTLLHHTANFGNQRGEWCDYHDGVAKKAMLSKENL